MPSSDSKDRIFMFVYELGCFLEKYSYDKGFY